MCNGRLLFGLFVEVALCMCIHVSVETKCYGCWNEMAVCISLVQCCLMCSLSMECTIDYRNKLTLQVDMILSLCISPGNELK